jgi:hypothetical protein
MGTKTIQQLTLRSNVDDTVNFPVDDGVQTYRVTAAQMFAYLWPQWFTITNIAAAGTALTSASRVVFLDPSSASFTQLLPALSLVATNFVVILKNVSAGANNVTLDANGSETIDGALTIALESYESVTLIKQSSTNWSIL